MYDLMNYDKGDPRHLHLIDFILKNKIDPDEGALYSSTLKVDHIQKIIQEVKDQLKDGIKLEPKRVDPNKEPEVKEDDKKESENKEPEVKEDGKKESENKESKKIDLEQLTAKVNDLKNNNTLSIDEINKKNDNIYSSS
ncbi:MAG: hypothetical protein K6F30_11560, partial [Lachnospiraceae bacterium]|nr:hypothetical protein [Lachnospiraceae bacterium]